MHVSTELSNKSLSVEVRLCKMNWYRLLDSTVSDSMLVVSIHLWAHRRILACTSVLAVGQSVERKARTSPAVSDSWLMKWFLVLEGTSIL